MYYETTDYLLNNRENNNSNNNILPYIPQPNMLGTFTNTEYGFGMHL